MPLNLRSFRSKVIALGLGAALVPVLILGTLSYQSQKHVIEEEFRAVLASLTAESADQITRWANDRRYEAELLAKSQSLRDETARFIQLSADHTSATAAQQRVQASLLRHSLELILLGYRWVVEASISDPRTGRVVMSTDEKRLGSTIFRWDDLDRIRQQHTYVTPIHPSEVPITNEAGELERGVPTMLIAVTLEDEGQVLGLLTLRLNVLEMRKELLHGGRFFTASGISSLDVYVVDNEGVFLTPSAFEGSLLASGRLTKRSVLELEARMPGTRQFTTAVSRCRSLLAGQRNVPMSDMDGYQDYRGVPVVGAWVPVTDAGWCVIAEVAEAEALAPVTRLLWMTLLVLLGIGVTFGLLAVGLSSTLTTPLTQLTSLAGQMAGGDRSVRFGLKHRQDEIGQLADSFDSMAATIEQHLTGLEAMVQERTANLVATNQELERQITVRKQAEEALAVAAQGLRDNEQKFRTLVDNIPGAIYLSAFDADWTMEFLSDAIEGIVGYPATHFLQNRVRSFASIIHPEDRGMVETAVRQGVSSRTPFIVEYRVLHADGSVRWVYEKGQGVFDAENNLLWIDGALFDVTERKRAQQRLAAQYAITRVLAESAGLEEAIPRILEAICKTLDWDAGMLWVPDRHTEVLRCVEVWKSPSKAIQEFESISRGQTFEPGVGLPGRVWQEARPVSIPDLSAEPSFPRAEMARQVGLRGAFGFPVSAGPELIGVMEFFSRDIRQPDEEVQRMLAATGSQIGQFIERVRAQQTLQEREEQLRQAQKMEAIGRLAGGIAHDFNNLLTAMMGYSQLLLRKIDENHPLRRYAWEIYQGGERAARLTGQLLAFSRKQVLQPKVLDLNAIITNMDLMFHRLLGEQIKLETALASDLGAVKADPGQLEQVILNLVVNSRDAMSNGGRLGIETMNVDFDAATAAVYGDVKAGQYVRLTVTDTGCGMDSGTLEHIFEPFFTTKGREKGTGLGLATVYGIVRQSGGEIEVTSQPNHGTTFNVYLPRVTENVETPIGNALSDEPLGGNETVLLVEDEQAVRSLARQVLEQNGYTVLDAINGAEALVLAEQHRGRINLVITDVVMPGISGPDVAHRLASLRPDIRILYMSGYTDNAIGDDGVLEDGTAYLAKPFSPDALLRKVREILDPTWK
jgi:PAS domain S-box-containing protein